MDDPWGVVCCLSIKSVLSKEYTTYVSECRHYASCPTRGNCISKVPQDLFNGVSDCYDNFS